MNLATTQWMKFSVKVISLLVFIYFTNHGFMPRLQVLLEERSTYTSTLVFIFLWSVGIVSLLIATFQQKWIARLFWAFLIAIVTGIGYGFYVAGGSEIEVLDVLELWQARHEAGRAFEFFQHAVIQAALIALLGFIIIMLPPPVLSGKARKYLSMLVWVPIVPIGLFTALIFIRSDKAVAGLPQQFTPLSIVSAVGYKLTTHPIPERAKINKAPERFPEVRHIVYLIDESINPDYIYLENGNFIKGLQDNKDKIADYGIAVSGSNCSARSNAILRLGGTRTNLIQNIRKSPTIWQYAKKAGFRTVYIDAQTSSIQITKPGGFQNYMTASEAKYIDKIHKINDVDVPMLDYRLIEIIQSELDTVWPTFIYANKNGAHFPYNKNYPVSEEVYKPVRASNKIENEEEMQGLINAYKNAVRWTVDLFFQKFFQQVELKHTAVIYTSDHGQNIAQPTMPHCSSGDDASPVEGLVPLMFITENDILQERFKNAARNNYNQADQFSIFPTLLGLFGYSKEIQKGYGSGLLGRNKTLAAAFNTGDILGVLSNDTDWKEVSHTERVKLLTRVPIKP